MTYVQIRRDPRLLGIRTPFLPGYVWTELARAIKGGWLGVCVWRLSLPSQQDNFVLLFLTVIMAVSYVISLTAEVGNLGGER